MTWRGSLAALLALKALPWVLAGVLLMAFLMTCGDDAQESIVSEETRREQARVMGDSIRESFKAEMDSLRHAADAASDAARLREVEAAKARERANRFAKDANEARAALATATSPHDSLAFLHVAYQ